MNIILGLGDGTIPATYVTMVVSIENSNPGQNVRWDSRGGESAKGGKAIGVDGGKRSDAAGAAHKSETSFVTKASRG